MFRRIYTAAVTLAVLGVIALGGSAFASAHTQHARHHAKRVTHALNAGTTQSTETAGAQSDGPGGPNVQSGANVQSGNQSGPDTGTAARDGASSENSGAEADGPGGYQDPPGSAGAQQQGQN